MHLKGRYGIDLKVLELLLSAKADPNIADKDEQTPLFNCSYKYIQPLVAHGANVNATDKDGNTPLHCALPDRYGTDPDVVEALIKNGANLHLKNKKGDTPLALLAERTAKWVKEFLNEADQKEYDRLKKRMGFKGKLKDLCHTMDTEEARELYDTEAERLKARAAIHKKMRKEFYGK